MPTILTILDVRLSFDANDIESIAYAACAQIELARAATTKAEYVAIRDANNAWFSAAIAAENKTSYSLSILREASQAIHAELDALIRRY